MSIDHLPVMLEETLRYLNPQPNENFIDCTLGAGGHAQAILERIAPRGKLLGIDLDEANSRKTLLRLNKFEERFSSIIGNYADLESHVRKTGFFNISGILLDLGVSSMQLDQMGGGFSFKSMETPDMRFSPNQKLRATEIINQWPKEKIEEIIRVYGEEPFASKISKAIVQARSTQSINRAIDLAELIAQAIPRSRWPKKIHPATKTFQALRIAVNRELENLEVVLPKTLKELVSGGRLVVISYHSLEDRIVKNFFKSEARDCVCPVNFPVCQCHHRAGLKILTTKSITPTVEEIKNNPRARSARLRAAQKI